MNWDRGLNFGLREQARRVGGSYVDWIDIAVVIAVHVAIGEQAIGKQGE